MEERGVFLMFVSEIMSRGVVALSPDDSVESAARLLAHHGVGALPVCGKDGRVRGMVTDRDIAVRCVAADLPPDTPVRSLMSRPVHTIDARADVREAALLMAEKQVRRLPVVNQGRLCGMLSLGDVAKSHTYGMEASQALTEISLPARDY